MQALPFKSDFEDDRRDRERISGDLEESEASVVMLETTVHQDRIKQLLQEKQQQEEKLNELYSQVDTLNEELQTACAQIRGYKTQSDGFRKELEDWRKQAEETEEVLQQSRQQAQENQEKVCPIIFVFLLKSTFLWWSNVVVLVKRMTTFWLK